MVRLRKSKAKATKVEAKAAKTKNVDEMIQEAPAHYENETREHLRRVLKGEIEVEGKE